MINRLAVSLCLSVAGLAAAQPSLEFVSRYESGIFAGSAAEIVAYDAHSQRLFVTNAANNTIDVLTIADVNNPTLAFSIDLSPFGGGVNSVAVRRGLVAVAVEAEVKQDPGAIVFFNADGDYLDQAEAGALPDMITFTPDGKYVMTANEGEPNDDYTVDPEGSVTIVRVPRSLRNFHAGPARTADFRRFDQTGVPEGVRVFGPGATPSQDIEPEYIAVSHNSRFAYVTCQENNAVAVVDIRRAQVVPLEPLGTKDHMDPANPLDVSNKDDAINIANWPVHGLYLPDAIGSYRARGQTYFVTANEGDSRDYDGFSEEARVKDLVLDPTAFPDAAALQADENLGRLKITTTLGDTDGDGDYDALYSYGARSMSIWSSDGRLVWDSADMIEQITAAAYPADFNSDNEENFSFDDRSDDKGPEPEALTIASVGDATYAFCGLERIGGIMVFDISDPYQPEFVDYINSRDFTGDPQNGTAGDLAPEGLVFIDAKDSPDGTPLLVAANEASGTTSIYRMNGVDGDCDDDHDGDHDDDHHGDHDDDHHGGHDRNGDLNRDGRTDTADLHAVLASLGDCTSDACEADLNGDGVVDRHDVIMLIELMAGN